MNNLTGTVVDNRYRITGEIARGGMGVVYKAERLKLGRALAIKFLLGWTDSEEARARFAREAKAMGRLHHPNLVTVTDFGVHESVPFLVMDFIHGLELQALLQAGLLPRERAVHIASCVLAGLAHAHDQGIVHRDIKPGNVLVHASPGFDDEVKLLDFGVARLQSEPSNLTDGMAIGTPAYMAPEQITGDPIDGRTDLYGVGVLLFHMLTGAKPYDHDDNLELLSMHRDAPRPRLHEHPDLEAVIQRAMAVDAADRYQSAAEMAKALRSSHASAHEPAPTPAPGSKPTPAPAPVPPPASGRLPTPAPDSKPTRAPDSKPTPAPGRLTEPKDRRRWLIIGGLASAVVIIAAIGLVAASSDAPRSELEPAVPAATTPAASGDIPGLAEAVAEVAQSNRRGTKRLEALVSIHPDNARVRYQLGRAYLARPWWPKGLAAYRAAIERDPSLSGDQHLIADALRGLSSRGSHKLAARFLVSSVGEPAVVKLEALAQRTKNKKLAARARRVIKAIATRPIVP